MTAFKTSNLIRLGSADIMLEIAKGVIADHSVINKFGHNTDIDTAASEDVWDGGGLNIQPTTDRVHTIASTSVEDAGTLLSSGTVTSGGLTSLIDSTATFSTDTVAVGDIILIDSLQDHSVVVSVDSETQLTMKSIHHGTGLSPGDEYRIVTSAGTGAAVIHIKLAYTENGSDISEFVILNGTTGVDTPDAFYRLNRMHIHGVGSNGVNVGTITATAKVDLTVSAQVNPDNGQTLMAISHVPMGYTGYITNYYASLYRGTKIADAMANIRLMSKLWGSNDDGVVIEHVIGVSISGGNSGHVFNPPKRISQGTDIVLNTEKVTDNDTAVSAGFDLILVKN